MAEDKRPRTDKPIRLWMHLMRWVFCGGVLMVLYGLGRDPQWVETHYVDGWGGEIGYGLAWVTSRLPISLGELVIGGLLLREILLFLSAWSDVGAGRRRAKNAFASGLLHVIDMVFLILMTFQLVWGLAYQRPPAIERLGWQDLVSEDPLDEAQVRALVERTEEAIAQVNRHYAALHPNGEIALTVPREGLDVQANLERGFQRFGETYELGEMFTRPRFGVKIPFSSVVMSYFGIGGIYFPFTGEPNVNGGPPVWSQALTSGHEKAHQRMVTSEDEATFYGFLACIYADDPYVQYAGWQYARRSLMRVVKEVDGEEYERLKTLVGEGPAEDQKAVYAYWTAYDGLFEEVGRTVNNTYLNANGVKGGVASYGRARWLVYAWTLTPEGQAGLVAAN